MDMPAFTFKSLEPLLAAGKGGMVLMDTKGPMMVRTTVGLLDVLLKGRDLSGLMVLTDRPYMFVSRLLDKQGIPQGKLRYLDAVSGISGEEPAEACNLETLSSPFCGSLVHEVFVSSGMGSTVRELGFVLVDNLNSLSTLVSDRCIHSFLEGLRTTVERNQGMVSIVVADRERLLTLGNIVDDLGFMKIDAIDL